MRKLVALALLPLLAGCPKLTGIARLGELSRPLDVVIVPGCPNLEDGRGALCQIERAAYASLLWERGMASRFITSGAAVQSPYVEAETLAQMMVALGVPADRVYLESDALHTDENMYYSMRIARALGARTVGVTSQPGHAKSSCAFIEAWGQPCVALPSDRDAAKARHRAQGGTLAALPFRKVADFVPLAEREHRMASVQERRAARLPSYLVYPTAAMMRLNGEVWVPHKVPPPIVVVSWTTHLQLLEGGKP